MTESSIHKLQVLQNRILRVMDSSPLNNTSHTADIRKSLGILSVKDQIKAQLSSFMWDFDHNLLPTHLSKSFLRASNVHNYNTRTASRGYLYLKKVTTTSFGVKSFKTQGAKILNELIEKDYFKNSKTKKSFLNKLKLEILESY